MKVFITLWIITLVLCVWFVIVYANKDVNDKDYQELIDENREVGQALLKCEILYDDLIENYDKERKECNFILDGHGLRGLIEVKVFMVLWIITLVLCVWFVIVYVDNDTCNNSYREVIERNKELGYDLFKCDILYNNTVMKYDKDISECNFILDGHGLRGLIER